jgi:chitodextrinase
VNLDANARGGEGADLAWEPATDNVAVTGYEIYRDDALIDTIGATTSYADTVAPGAYTYVVRALDASGNRSDPSNSASITVPDTAAPTTPAGLTATAVGPDQIDLTWDEASDNVGVTGYEIHRDGALLITIGAVTSYSDGVLAPATHTYEVRALDAAGNRSDPSNEATATVVPPDLEPPTAPANLAGTFTAAGAVELTWDASSDDIGVTGYRVYRDGQALDDVSTTSFADPAPALGSRAYEVRALDAAGRLSEPSNGVVVLVTDLEAPAAPQNLAASAVGSSQIDLTWDAAGDNVAVTGYEIHRDGNLLATIGATTSYSDFVLAPATHTYEVRALDAAGNRSGPSNTSTATVSPPDGEAPTVPGNLQATGSAGQVSLSWDASSDNVAVTAYRVYRDGGFLADLEAVTSFADTGLAAGTYDYEVRALDAAGNVSDASTASATVPDTERPAAPTGLQAAASGPSQIDLSWETASDNVGVTGYRVVRGSEEIAILGSTTTFADTNRPPGSYSYTVRAEDAAGNLSDPSNTANATIAAPTIRTILPEADAEVNAGAPTTNYATAKLRTDGGSTPEDTFLRFTVTGVSGAVQSAVLRLFVYTGTADGPALYSTTNSWTETGLVWNNRPLRTSAATDDKGAIASNTWAEFDVTQFVTGNDTYSFTLAQTASDGINIRSREYTSNTANRPQLVVTAP